MINKPTLMAFTCLVLASCQKGASDNASSVNSTGAKSPPIAEAVSEEKNSDEELKAFLQSTLEDLAIGASIKGKSLDEIYVDQLSEFDGELSQCTMIEEEPMQNQYVCIIDSTIYVDDSLIEKREGWLSDRLK